MFAEEYPELLFGEAVVEVVDVSWDVLVVVTGETRVLVALGVVDAGTCIPTRKPLKDPNDPFEGSFMTLGRYIGVVKLLYVNATCSSDEGTGELTHLSSVAEFG